MLPRLQGQHYKISLIRSVVDKCALLTDGWLNFFWEDPKWKLFHNNFKAWFAFFHYANICSECPKAMVGKVLTVTPNYSHKIKMPVSLSKCPWWNRNVTNFIQLRHLFTRLFFNVLCDDMRRKHKIHKLFSCNTIVLKMTNR